MVSKQGDMAILAEHIGIQDLYKTSKNLHIILCNYAHDSNFVPTVSVSVAALLWKLDEPTGPALRISSEVTP
jgi:hypothetical protein